MPKDMVNDPALDHIDYGAIALRESVVAALAAAGIFDFEAELRGAPRP